MLDNRPRVLVLTNLPDSVPLKIVMGRFKNFGLIDDIDLEADPKTVTFASHDAAAVAMEKGKELKFGEDTITLEMELQAVQEPAVVKVVATADETNQVEEGAQDEKDEDDEDEEEEEGEKNWKR